MPYRIRSPFTHQRIGRRGACLLVFGFIPAMTGAALFLQPKDRSGRPRTIPILELIAPAEVWSAIWIALGVATMVTSFLSWKAQRIGFVLAYALPLFWGAALIVSWLTGRLVTGWIAALVYLGYCSLVVVIAGWEEPAVLPPASLPEEVRDDA